MQITFCTLLIQIWSMKEFPCLIRNTCIIVYTKQVTLFFRGFFHTWTGQVVLTNWFFVFSCEIISCAKFIKKNIWQIADTLLSIIQWFSLGDKFWWVDFQELLLSWKQQDLFFTSLWQLLWYWCFVACINGFQQHGILNCTCNLTWYTSPCCHHASYMLRSL